MDTCWRPTIGEITGSYVIWTDGGASSPITSSMPTATHVYVDPGVFNVRLVVKFVCGPTMTQRWQVKVGNSGSVEVVPIR